MDAQYKQQNSKRFDDFVTYINLLFTGIFAIELGINMFANWMHQFIRSGWNWFDLFIVLMSLLDFGPFDNPFWLVRLMRAFRVVRLFGRVHELTKMISAITASLFPMLNAFVILLVVLSICECIQHSYSCSIRFFHHTTILFFVQIHALLKGKTSDFFRQAEPDLIAFFQIPYSEFRSSPTSPPTSSAGSTAPSSRSSASRRATPGSTRSPRSGPTASWSGSRPSTSAASSSSACGWCCR
jgi:hypothetical protein